MSKRFEYKQSKAYVDRELLQISQSERPYNERIFFIDHYVYATFLCIAIQEKPVLK